MLNFETCKKIVKIMKRLRYFYHNYLLIILMGMEFIEAII